MRNTPFDPTLRIDHVQHALAALLGAADLMPAEGPAKPGVSSHQQ
jgi:hypothetical protein